MPLADDLLGAEDMPILKVLTPEWAPKVPHVHIRTLTAEELEKFRASWEEAEKNKQSQRDLLLAWCLTDEKGNRIFTDAQAPQLGKKSARVMERLFGAALRHNGIGQKAVEEIAKNS